MQVTSTNEFADIGSTYDIQRKRANIFFIICQYLSNYYNYVDN